MYKPVEYLEITKDEVFVLELMLAQAANSWMDCLRQNPAFHTLARKVKNLGRHDDELYEELVALEYKGG